jgi:hypothetical protein
VGNSSTEWIASFASNMKEIFQELALQPLSLPLDEITVLNRVPVVVMNPIEKAS